ncbi:MAG: hypothetical protein GXP27_20840 [Planctomycetes bacterium]|nr:hypothetical protein [Planctomycetota bacterium]
MTRNIFSCAALLAVAMGATVMAAGPPAFVPHRDDGAVVLFDAARDSWEKVRNYTARWINGSDLRPRARGLEKNGERWIEFTFQGSRGMACSTFYFTPPPEPEKGRQYKGIELIIDCDRDDYPHIGVQVAFTDQTQLTRELALERGTHAYLVDSGFRRAKRPPRWELIRYVMLTLRGGRRAADMTYRLRRIALREIPAAASEPAEGDQVPDLFGELVLLPEPKEVRRERGRFIANRPWPLFVSKTASDRTRRTAELFANRYEQFTGLRLARREFQTELPTTGIVLRLVGAAPGGGSARGGAPEAVSRAQGYTLLAEPERIVITGADEPGLYYGTVTFFQLMRHAAKRVETDLAIPCVTIRDWPDTLHRLVRLERSTRTHSAIIPFEKIEGSTT